MLQDARRIDIATYTAIAATPTPALDGAMRTLSRAADYSRLSLSAAAALALLGGEDGRRAAKLGVASLTLTSVTVNLILKPLGGRRRPDPLARQVPLVRRVRMPRSRSFPSGHTAAAFAFAGGVGQVLPAAGAPLRVLAALVGYSRVHTGVHYPSDVVAGALLGGTVAQFTAAALEHQRAARRTESSTAATAAT